MMTMTRLFAAACLLLVPASTAWSEIQMRQITYDHQGQKLAGYFAWDDRVEGKRPGVLVVHEWWGLNDYARDRARKLAELGYVAFALDMYGEGKVAEHPKDAAAWSGKIQENVDAWVARANVGLKQLLGHELVDRDRVAAIGYCFGGATVCQLAYHNAPLQGVASFHGSLPVPTTEQASNMKSSVLICHGSEDGFIPRERIEEFQTTMNAGDADWMMISYSGAKHSFTNPAADERGIDGLQYHPAADRRSWKHMQVFFDEVFAP